MSDEGRPVAPLDAPVERALTVLLVEDEPGDRWLLAEALRARGHAVVACSSAEEAWAAYEEHHPPLVLLDLLLPGDHGLELARRIRASPDGAWTVILVVTVKRDPHVLAAVLEAGADDYLAKPVEIPLLNVRLAVAERMVERQRERRRVQEVLARRTDEIRTLFENLDEVFFSLDLAGDRLIQLSPGADRLLGEAARSSRWKDGDWRGVLFPRDPSLAAELERVEPGGSVTLQYPVERADGGERWIEAAVKAEPGPSGGVLRLDGVLSDVTEQRRAREQLAARNRELATLYRISEITLSAGSPEHAYDEVLEEIGRTTGFPVALLAQHDAERGTLVVVGSRGLELDDEDAEIEVGVTNTLPGRTLEEGRALTRNVGRQDELGHPALDGAGLRTWLSVPLTTSGDVVGVLVLADTSEWLPDERLVRWAGSLAGTIASFIDRLTTQAALQESEQRFRALADKLQQANQELEAFAYSVSHDLRAPLRTMQGFAHTLLRDHGDALAPDARDFVHRIIRSGQASEELIADLLAYSRLSSEELELGRVELGEVVAAALEVSAADLDARDADVRVEDGLPAVHGHLRVLEQVVTNLVANAAKFVPATRRPEIRIRAEKREGRATRLWVVDNGIGVAPAVREKVFRVFERHDRDGANRPGTGIGLAIVRRGMQRIGGTAGVEDPPEGEGAAFWIELPLEPRDADRRPWARWRRGSGEARGEDLSGG